LTNDTVGQREGRTYNIGGGLPKYGLTEVIFGFNGSLNKYEN